MLPNGWKKVKLGEICDKIGSGSTPKGGREVYLNAGIPIIRSQNVLNGFLDLNDVAFISDEQHSKMKGTWVHPNDILLNITGASIGRSCVVPATVKTANVNQHVCIIRLKECADACYVCNLILSKDVQKQIELLSVGGGRQGLNFQQIASFSFLLPPIEEQEKIAEILSTQDRVIELKEKLIAEKQKQKKYLMSVLLGDDFKKPFKLNGVIIDKKKWEKKKIGEICDTFSGGTPSRSHPEYFNGEIPWIKSGELNQKNIYETEEFLTQKGIECSSAKMVKKGTLLIAMYGATAGVLAVTHIDAAINQAILALIPNMDINPFYLKSAIANQIDVAVHRLVQGGQPNFNASIINAFELRLPTLPEQTAIAEVLSAADEEISLLQKSLEQEKLKKKSLMQLLLTGLVRVQ